MANSEELIDTIEYLMQSMRCSVNRFCYNQVCNEIARSCHVFLFKSTENRIHILTFYSNLV